MQICQEMLTGAELGGSTPTTTNNDISKRDCAPHPENGRERMDYGYQIPLGVLGCEK